MCLGPLLHLVCPAASLLLSVALSPAHLLPLSPSPPAHPHTHTPLLPYAPSSPASSGVQGPATSPSREGARRPASALHTSATGHTGGSAPREGITRSNALAPLGGPPPVWAQQTTVLCTSTCHVSAGGERLWSPSPRFPSLLGITGGETTPCPPPPPPFAPALYIYTCLRVKSRRKRLRVNLRVYA